MGDCCCLRKGGFDVQLDYADCKTIRIHDLSQVLVRPGADLMRGYEVRVEYPAAAASGTIWVPLHGSVQFDSTLFDKSEHPKCIPDGVLCFTVESCGLVQTINRAFLCNTQCRIDTLRARGRREEDFRETAEYQQMLDAVGINAQYGKVQQAADLLKLLHKRLEKHKCDCGCL